MGAVEILFTLENKFDIRVPDEEVRSMHNVCQMREGVERGRRRSGQGAATTRSKTAPLSTRLASRRAEVADSIAPTPGLPRRL